jgi:hypothetical protein
MANTLSWFYLQIGGLGNRTVLAEPLDRTQEVDGSNPPGSTLFSLLTVGSGSLRCRT